MNNAEIFSQTFGIYATEMWAMPESEFLSWLNSLHDVNATNTTDSISRADALRFTNPEDWGTPDERWMPESEYGRYIQSLPSTESEEFEWCHDCKEYDQEAHCCHRWTKVIRNTVEELKAERTGHWMEMGTNKDGTHNIKCSKCGEGYKTKGHARSIATKAKYKFCPNCGARMVSEDAEQC